MLFDAPRKKDFPFLPLLTDKAAPAAICCFFDFAAYYFFLETNLKKRLVSPSAVFS